MKMWIFLPQSSHPRLKTEGSHTDLNRTIIRISSITLDSSNGNIDSLHRKDSPHHRHRRSSSNKPATNTNNTKINKMILSTLSRQCGNSKVMILLP